MGEEMDNKLMKYAVIGLLFISIASVIMNHKLHLDNEALREQCVLVEFHGTD